MPTKKRRRPVTADDDPQRSSKAHSRTRAPLASFASLPLELRQLIVDLAYHSPSPVSSYSFSLSPFEVGTGTMYNLALVCREFNAQVTPLLWATVAITRPSALYALHQALLASPERAKMITSLHIGPQDALPSYWWPLSRTVVDAYQYTAGLGPESGFTSHWIATSLDKTLLPSGCVSREAWRWDRSTPGCRGAAIWEALEVIKATRGLDFRAHGYHSPTTIAPVFEAQAALDLYLGAIRRREEEDPGLVKLAKPGSRVPLPCRNGKCEHYPVLLITGAPKLTKPAFLAKRHPPVEQPPRNAFVLPYAQVLCHLARPGSVTDRFDHPLPLVRSGFNVMVTVRPAAPAEAKGVYEASEATYKMYSGTWDVRQHEATQWASQSVLHEAVEQAVGEGQDARGYGAATSLATFGSVLGLARGVRGRAVNVQNLSLTGYLESATLDKVFDSTLTRLSIGPALPCWDATLPVRQLTGVEELRICGRNMSTHEAWLLALGTQQLKTLVWSLAEPDKHQQSLADIMDVLLSTENGVPTAVASEPEKFREWIKARSEAGPPASPPLIMARLHHTDIVKLLRAAPSDEIKAAWLAGRLTPGACRRLLVKENRRAFALASSSSNESSTGSDSSSSPIWELMYREGREYWRDGEGEASQIEEEEEAAEEEEEEEDAQEEKKKEKGHG